MASDAESVNGLSNGNVEEEVMEDLFGDEEEQEEEEEELPHVSQIARNQRRIDDEELDSGDDIDRNDRAPEEEVLEEDYETREKTSIDLDLVRRPIPEPSDGELYVLKVPGFLDLEPLEWQHDKFQPPTTDHHSRKDPSSTFSPYTTAMTTLRWRHSPTDPTKLQSNARILRWVDGSLTIQLASNPTIQYEIDGNLLAPPQRNPLKPTPTSVKSSHKGGRQGDGTVLGEKYDPSKDAFTYMLLPDENAQSLRVIHKVTAGLSIKQSDSSADDAIERLQAALANAANANKGTGNLDMTLIDEDPEERRRRAEEMMRQKAKADRRRDAAIQREADRSNRALGRHGLSSTRYGGGLDADMLEDEDGGGGFGASRPKAAPRKRRQRRDSEYSSEEDMGRNRFSSKQDEYDQEDDFVAPSDEEEVIEDDDEEDEDDGIIEDLPRRQKSPKRDRPAEVDADADAEGEIDEDVQTARTKRRRVIDDDDEDEDEE